MPDEVIAEVRRIRREISRRCGHDAHKVVAYYRDFQERLKETGSYQFVEKPAAIAKSTAQRVETP